MGFDYNDGQFLDAYAVQFIKRSVVHVVIFQMVINNLTIPMVGKNLSFNLVLGITGVVNEPRYRYYLLLWKG